MTSQACPGAQLTQVVVPPTLRSVPQPLKSLGCIPIFPNNGVLPKKRHFERPKSRYKRFHFKCSCGPKRSCIYLLLGSASDIVSSYKFVVRMRQFGPSSFTHSLPSCKKYLNVGEGGHLYKLFRIIFTVSEPDRPASIKMS